MSADKPRALYWLISGAMLGIGFNSILFLILVPAGFLLLAYGVTRFPRTGFWLTLVGFSIPVIGLTLYPYYTIDHCGPGMELTARGVGEEVTCMHFPPGYLSKLTVYVVLLGAGLLWGVIETLKRRPKKTEFR